jgi:hypothetical protein
VDNFEFSVIRNKLHDFYDARSQFPTMQKLRSDKNIQYHGSRELLGRTLQLEEIGWQQKHSYRKALRWMRLPLYMLMKRDKTPSTHAHVDAFYRVVGKSRISEMQSTPLTDVSVLLLFMLDRETDLYQKPDCSSKHLLFPTTTTLRAHSVYLPVLSVVVYPV